MAVAQMKRNLKEEFETIRNSISYISNLDKQVIMQGSVDRLKEIGSSTLPCIEFKQQPGLMKFAFHTISESYALDVAAKQVNNSLIYEVSYNNEPVQTAFARYVEDSLSYIFSLDKQIITQVSVSQLNEIGESALPCIRFKQEPGLMKFTFQMINEWHVLDVAAKQVDGTQIYEVSCNNKQLQTTFARHVERELDEHQKTLHVVPSHVTEPPQARTRTPLHDPIFEEIKAFVQEVREIRKQQP